MELVKVCAFALMGVLFALQFKGGKQEYGIYLGAALAVVVFSCTLSYMGQAKKQLMGLWQQLSGGQSYLTLLFKVVGITWISELVSGICKDSGYSAVASQVELFGKIAILFAGMPIFLAPGGNDCRICRRVRGGTWEYRALSGTVESHRADGAVKPVLFFCVFGRF